MKTLLMFTITTIKTRCTCPRLKSDALVYRLGHTSIQFIAPTECFKEFCGYISKRDHIRKQTLPCLLNSTFEHIVHSDHCSDRRGEEKEKEDAKGKNDNSELGRTYRNRWQRCHYHRMLSINFSRFSQANPLYNTSAP